MCVCVCVGGGGGGGGGGGRREGRREEKGGREEGKHLLTIINGIRCKPNMNRCSTSFLTSSPITGAVSWQPCPAPLPYWVNFQLKHLSRKSRIIIKIKSHRTEYI